MPLQPTALDLSPAELDGLRGGVPAAMPPAEVIALFDDMAPRFDALLVDQLEYRVPERLRAVLAGVAPDRRFQVALDLGCGTGLMGAQLRPRVDRLDGVDVSPRMIEAARARAVYDHLREAEVVDHLRETTVRYDLIVATDVLIYIGDLAPLFAVARAALAGGGLFACSIEGHDGVDVHRAATGRYQHSRGYVERMAAAHDLDVLAFAPTEIRLEAGAFISGWVFVTTAARTGARRARRRYDAAEPAVVRAAGRPHDRESDDDPDAGPGRVRRGAPVRSRGRLSEPRRR
ncbi:MAG: methyltransferase [Kofleriaceae bacterium]